MNPNVHSHIPPERARRAIQNQYNPLRGLTLETLGRQLDAARAGYLREIALTWEAIENRDLYLKNVSTKRKKAVARNGWEVLTLDDSAEAARQKTALEYFYNHLTASHALDAGEQGGFSLLARQMMDAVGKGHAVHEILWQPAVDGTLTAEFRFVPLWFFENTTGAIRFLETEYALHGVALEPGGWMVSRGDGLMEPCSIAYAFKTRPLADWLHYCEMFGIPSVIGKTPAAKSSADWKTMEEAVRSIASGSVGVLSSTEVIEFLETRSSGQLPFPPLVEYMDRAIASIWRGSDLSTLSRVNAVGASLQEEESALLQEDDAQFISETLNTQVDRLVLKHLFGDAPRLAYIRVLAPQRQNIDQDLRIDEFLASHGAPLEVQHTLERYGRTPPRGGQPVLNPTPLPKP